MIGDTKLGSNLVFIISQPRAGSTLLQRVLGNHPQIFTVSEPWVMLHPVYALKKEGVTAEYDASLANWALEEFLRNAPEGRQLYIHAVREMALVLYGRLLGLSGKDFFLDKTPRYYFIIPELREIFPNGNFIILLRNPLAILSSVLQTWFNNQPQPLIQSKSYTDLVDGPHYLLNGIKQLQGRATIVHYEDLVRNPNCTVKHLCDQLGIPFSPEMITYGSYPPLIGSLGDPTGIHRHTAPVTDYLDTWKRNLCQSDELLNLAKQYLEKLGAQTIQDMGYSYADLQNALQSGFL
jgi:hypothetical protein